MTGRIFLTPEAERQLNEIDDWIAASASAEVARHFVSAILDHTDSIATFPFVGRAREDVRPGMRTTTFRKRTLVAYVVEEASGERVVTILGIFHGGQDWEGALHEDQVEPDTLS